MKRLLVLLLLAALAFGAYEYRQVQFLREETARLNQQPTSQQPAPHRGDATDETLQQAKDALERARQALSSEQAQQARTALATAQERLTAAARTAEEHTKPVLARLQAQAQELTQKVRTQFPAGQ